MTKDFKRTIAFLLFLLAGIILGTILGRLCSGVSFLSWLAYSISVGLDTDSPLVLDLIIFKLAFGVSLTVNTAQIICIIAAVLIYNNTCKSL